jgi:hypothetical protein
VTRTDLSRIQTAVEFSQYNEGIPIGAPPESDAIIELYGTWPRDGDTHVSLNAALGFQLPEPASVMILPAEPAVRLR